MWQIRHILILIQISIFISLGSNFHSVIKYNQHLDWPNKTFRKVTGTGTLNFEL